MTYHNQKKNFKIWKYFCAAEQTAGTADLPALPLVEPSRCEVNSRVTQSVPAMEEPARV